MRLGDQNAIIARDETRAEMLASSVMDELLSGIRPLQACNQQAFDYEMEDPWVFSVIIESTNYADVLRVGVRVELPLDTNKEPPHYELYRWVVNPDYVTQIEDDEASIAEVAAETATRAATPASSSTNGTGTTGAGGGG